MELQPLLHDLLVAATAPTQAWSAPDGQVRPHGAQGFYDGDTRVLSRAELTVAGAQPETVAAGPAGPGAVEVVSLLRTVDEPAPDPTLRLRRRRVVTPGRVEETLDVAAATVAPVRVPLRLALACDLAEMEHVKTGRPGTALPASGHESGQATDHAPTPDAVPGPAGPSGPSGPSLGDSATASPLLRWQQGDVVVGVTASGGATVDLTDASAPSLAWDLTLHPGETVRVTWAVEVTGAEAPVLAAPSAPTWATPRVVADDRRLAPLLERSLEDLVSLRMRARFAPDDVFVAAGAPWFFTLFGRDSIWAARMLLPLGTELAAGTLRTLAARQGTRTDPVTAEQPGKILHEVRSKDLELGDGSVLPPVYYGTVDATPLWVCLLHDAWRWGMPEAEVEALLPALEAALTWVVEHGDADGDGFLEYLDESGRGLANQGWKDSGDSVQWRDGTLATGPIALCEVQGYAHEAALAGAALLDAFGRPGAERWREWAGRLRERFRAAFWVEDADGRYPAIALDADKRAVDTLTSNIGHLLGTGLLDAEEEAAVAARLASPTMDSGYGLRTMATTSGGYWPLRYHGGSVWTHDTAIAVVGLARSGHGDVAAALTEGLLAAATDVAYRLPELYSGDARGTVPAMVPYPAACRPQAWAAASSVAVLAAALGLAPDVPGGTVQVRPVTPSPFGAVRVEGLRVAGAALTVEVDAAGAVREVTAEAPTLALDLP